MVTFPTTTGTSSRLGSTLQAKEPEADEVLARLRQFGPAQEAPRGPKPGEIRVRVFNGSGQSGIAAKTGSDLTNQGFVTAGVGNKPTVGATEVRYRRGSLDKARVVQSYLSGVGKLVEDGSVVEADVAVVVGKDFKAVAPPAGAAPAGPTAPPPVPAPAPGPPPSPAPNGKPAGPAADQIQC